VGVLMTKDGKTAWVSLGKANHVAEVDVASRKVRRTVLAGKRAWGLALSPDEATLYITNALSDDMTLVDTREGKAIRRLSLQKREYLKGNLENVNQQDQMAMTINERVVVSLS
jgi:DNA-binding beta-propeller fold protein YncE